MKNTSLWCCISFDSYIKPQPRTIKIYWTSSCISFDSYIKPQLVEPLRRPKKVVYLLIPTSNHNSDSQCSKGTSVVYLLIPTSNHNSLPFIHLLSPVVYLLIPTSNHNLSRCLNCEHRVVYLLIPTSNHNHRTNNSAASGLYIFWFLHQTTTRSQQKAKASKLYIFWFLHQTTTLSLINQVLWSCISFDSYIKPQPGMLLPISCTGCISFDSYIKPQRTLQRHSSDTVVYLLIPTSNHNYQVYFSYCYSLYIFWFLHQTTTEKQAGLAATCCISFDSYIKPQPTDLNILIFSA